ncbi:MAG: RNA polymerase sigma factor [Microthrixaceae bacterium]
MSRNPDDVSGRIHGVSLASDEALLAGISLGDEASARTFVRRFQHRVFGVAILILGDRQAAEDVAQETFVRVWRHAGGFDARRGAVAPWVLTIARNAAIDAVRMRRSVAVDPAALESLLGASTRQSPSQDVEHAMTVDRVTRALGIVPVEQRRSVVLAALYGRTAAEVAEIESIPLGTAKTRIRSGLRRIRELLNEELVDDEVLR